MGKPCNIDIQHRKKGVKIPAEPFSLNSSHITAVQKMITDRGIGDIIQIFITGQFTDGITQLVKRLRTGSRNTPAGTVSA